MSAPKINKTNPLEALFKQLRALKLIPEKSLVDEDLLEDPLEDSLDTLDDIWKEYLNIDWLKELSPSEFKQALDNWRGEGVEGMPEGQGLKFQIETILQNEIKNIKDLAANRPEKEEDPEKEEKLTNLLTQIEKNFHTKIEEVDKTAEAMFKQKSQSKP